MLAKRIIFFLITLAALTAACAGISHAALLNDRGVRAFSMDGAFVAQADDSSALWYNPAGLVQTTMPKFDLTFQSLSPDATGYGSYDMLSSSWAANFKYVGLGMNYVNYDYTYDQYEITEFSFGIATNFGTEIFSLGLSGGNINYLDKSTAYGNEEDAAQFALGALLKIVNTEKFALKLGIVNRPQSDDSGDYYTGSGATIYRADSKEFGLNAQIITGMPVINVNLQYDDISYNWSDVDASYSWMDHGMKATTLGLEVTLPLSEYFSLSFRSGFGDRTQDVNTVYGATYNNYYYDASSTSFGLGFTAGKHFAFDVGTRSVSFSHPTQASYDRDYTTFGVSLLF